jgi:hypothetical protein
MRTGSGVPDQRAQTEAIDHQEDDVAGAASDEALNAASWG